LSEHPVLIGPSQSSVTDLQSNVCALNIDGSTTLQLPPPKLEGDQICTAKVNCKSWRKIVYGQDELEIKKDMGKQAFLKSLFFESCM
jgi:hypothetical protein